MATLKYFAQKTKDGYPIPSTMMGFKQAPKADTLVEILPQDYTALPGQSVLAPDSGLRYFVRRKANGEIIPNSLITSLKKPKGLVYEFKLVTGTAIPVIAGLEYPTFPGSLGIGSEYIFEPYTWTLEGTDEISYTGGGLTYSATGLASGLTINTTTGIISGTVSGSPTSGTAVITATNLAGSVTHEWVYETITV